ncbi:fungal-specific transcription factor domain-containing protein [Aspergillus unguis]
MPLTQPQSTSDARTQAISLDHGADGAPPSAPQNTSLDISAVRSCITCRRRKVRCNKRSPCSNCVRAGIECIFPPAGRAPRKTKRPPVEHADLLSRLQELESMVETAMASSNVQTAPSANQQRGDHSSGDMSDASPPHDEGGTNCPVGSGQLRMPPLEHEFGRLVVDDSRSRYVSNRTWASLGDQIEELQDILDPTSSEDEDPSTRGPSSSYSTTHDGMVFGFYAVAHSLQSLHPPPSKIPLLWDIYAENVKPLLPVVYGPIAQQLFEAAAQSSGSLDKNKEALLLAMYFAAIVSMSAEQCMTRLGEARDTLVGRYRFAVEQALSKANLLNTQSLTLMQATVIFLNAVRQDDDTKFAWSMSALLVRLAQGLGLHRDGSTFALNPFDVEMRRRLWWHIILIDLRSSEDHGTDIQIQDRMFDTRLPLNVNDADIFPNMKEQPTPRAGFTDMSFFLIRCDICYALRRVTHLCPNAEAGNTEANDNCPNVVQIVNKRIEDQYLKHCDMADPLQWISATIARLVLTKMWLVIHDPITRSKDRSQISQEGRESLFITSIEVTEFVRLIQEDEATRKWSWMFDAHMQWHAMVIVLSELCIHPTGPLADRAWSAVTTLYEDWLRTAKKRKGMLWRPIAKLMQRAGDLRKRKLDELLSFTRDDSHHDCHFTSPDQDRPSIGSSFSTHFPEHSKLVAAAPSMDLDSRPAQGPLDFDMSPGPMGIFNGLFPEGNFFATPQNQGLDTSQASADPDTSTTMPGDSGNPTRIPQNTFTPLADDDDWDQVLRDFQTDMQGMPSNPIGDITAWIS